MENILGKLGTIFTLKGTEMKTEAIVHSALPLTNVQNTSIVS